MMKHFFARALALLAALLLLLSCGMPAYAALAQPDAPETTAEAAEEAFAAGAAAQTPEAQEEPESPAPEPRVRITAPQLSVTVGQTMALTATPENFETLPERILWQSGNPAIATVSDSGVVTGKKVGRVTITAVAVAGETRAQGSYEVCVTPLRNAVSNLLEKQQVLSYRYSYIDDYYYTDNDAAWQRNFGFTKAYDLVAPYLLMEYDYVRVHFTYEEKDWMIQLWKGQYGLVFYGGEMGVYNKPASQKEDGVFTKYNCAAPGDQLQMGMSLYHSDLRGVYQHELTREYDSYWWCTGFKPGHLRVQEPASELRMVSHITLKDAEMTRLFAEGLKSCGFRQAEAQDRLGLDEFCVEGNDVFLKWQNISEAENTMPVKVTAGVLVVVNMLAIFLLLASLGFFGLLFLLVLI